MRERERERERERGREMEREKERGREREGGLLIKPWCMRVSRSHVRASVRADVCARARGGGRRGAHRCLVDFGRVHD